MLQGLYIPAAVGVSVGIAHIIKAQSHHIRTGEWSWKALLWDTGGMPSGHSAAVSALATAVLFSEGFSVGFWISMVLALVVIRDAFGVRKSVGDQARILNVLLSHAKVEQKVKIVLGHSPLQVGVGVLLGAAVAAGLWFL